MKTIKYIFSLVLLSFLYTSAVAQKQTPPEGGTPHDFKLPEKNLAKLSN
jgi:hypothetical protein